MTIIEFSGLTAISQLFANLSSFGAVEKKRFRWDQHEPILSNAYLR